MVNIDIEGFGRWPAFSRIRNLHDKIEGPINWAIFDLLKEENAHRELHSLTCNILRMDAKSVTIDSYLTEKVIKYKITGHIKVEAKLVDDYEIDSEVWEDLRDRKVTSWKRWDGNIPFDLVSSEFKEKGEEGDEN